MGFKTHQHDHTGHPMDLLSIRDYLVGASDGYSFGDVIGGGVFFHQVVGIVYQWLIVMAEVLLVP